MALYRVCSLGRFLFPRGSTRVARSVVISTQKTVPHRQFASAPWLLQEAASQQRTISANSISSDAISESLRKKNTASVAMMMLPKRATRSDIEKLCKDAGLDVANIEMRLCRFTYGGDRYAFVELRNEQQARNAIEKLNGNRSLGEPFYVKPLKADYRWGVNETTDNLGHYVWWNGDGVSKAIQPLLEGRRLHVSVKTPGWGPRKAPIGERNRANREIVERTFSEFGIEAISPISPNWGNLKLHPRFLCFVDFQTKEGMDEAIRILHDKDVDGKKVWLTPAQIAPWKAFHIGRVAPEKLAQLQKQELAPEKIDEERFSKPFVRRRVLG